MNVVRCFIFLLFLQLILGNAAFGKVYEYVANSRAIFTIPLSLEGINRLSFKNDRIQKIIGNLDNYQIGSEPALGCIFISTKFASGVSSYASILTEKGLLQDIQFKIIDALEPSIITINQSNMGAIKRPTPEEKQPLESGIISAIKDIALGRTRDYVFRVLEIDDLELLLERYEISKIVEYSNKFLKVKKIEYLSLEKDANANINLEAIAKLYPSVLAVAHMPNAIYLVFRL